MRVRLLAPSSFSLKTLFCCDHLCLLRCFLSSHSVQISLFSSILFFSRSPGACFLIRHHPPYFYFHLLDQFYLFYCFRPCVPWVLTLILFLFRLEQALCATTARLRIPCRVLSWPPILWGKSSRICETSTALNDWTDGTRLTYLCVGIFLKQ